MTLIARPGGIPDPARDIAHAEHFQIVCVANDMTRAQAMLAERNGIREIRHLEGDLPDGGPIHVELAWVDPLICELLTVDGLG